MMTPRLLMLTLTLSLAGCEAVDNFRLSSATERYKNMCSTSTTIGCQTQLVEMNILMLEKLHRKTEEQQNELVRLSGTLGYDNILKDINQQIEHQQSLKPSAIADWFLAESPTESANAPISIDFYDQLKTQAIKGYEQSISSYVFDPSNLARWQALNRVLASSIWPQ